MSGALKRTKQALYLELDCSKVIFDHKKSYFKREYLNTWVKKTNRSPRAIFLSLITLILAESPGDLIFKG